MITSLSESPLLKWAGRPHSLLNHDLDSDVPYGDPGGRVTPVAVVIDTRNDGTITGTPDPYSTGRMGTPIPILTV